MASVAEGRPGGRWSGEYRTFGEDPLQPGTIDAEEERYAPPRVIHPFTELLKKNTIGIDEWLIWPNKSGSVWEHLGNVLSRGPKHLSRQNIARAIKECGKL